MQRPSFALLMLCGALALGLTVADRTSRPKLASKARARSVARVTKAILPKPKALSPATTVPSKIPTASTTTKISTASTASTAALHLAPPPVADAVVAISAGEDRPDTIPSWLLNGDQDPVDVVATTLVDGSGGSRENAASPSTAEVTTATSDTAEPTATESPVAESTPTESPVAELTPTESTTPESTTMGATEAVAGNWSLTAWVIQRLAVQRAAIRGVEAPQFVPQVMRRLRDMALVVDQISASLRRAGGEMFDAATRPTTAPQAGG